MTLASFHEALPAGTIRPLLASFLRALCVEFWLIRILAVAS